MISFCEKYKELVVSSSECQYGNKTIYKVNDSVTLIVTYDNTDHCIDVTMHSIRKGILDFNKSKTLYVGNYKEYPLEYVLDALASTNNLQVQEEEQ